MYCSFLNCALGSNFEIITTIRENSVDLFIISPNLPALS